jgi:hypothetical protein
MKLTHEVLELRTKHAFNIARAAGPMTCAGHVWVRITDNDGTEGWGEAAANGYYGETADTVVAVLPVYERALQATLGDADGFDVLALQRAETCCRAGGRPQPGRTGRGLCRTSRPGRQEARRTDVAAVGPRCRGRAAFIVHHRHR